MINPLAPPRGATGPMIELNGSLARAAVSDSTSVFVSDSLACA
jgi:hypothetical protein